MRGLCITCQVCNEFQYYIDDCSITHLYFQDQVLFKDTTRWGHSLDLTSPDIEPSSHAMHFHRQPLTVISQAMRKSVCSKRQDLLEAGIALETPLQSKDCTRVQNPVHLYKDFFLPVTLL